MKTVVIWDEMEGEIKFAVIDRDVTHLNGIYVNQCARDDEDEAKQEQLQSEVSNLFYSPDGSQENSAYGQLSTEFPVQAVKDGAAVIVCGFLP